MNSYRELALYDMKKVEAVKIAKELFSYVEELMK